MRFSSGTYSLNHVTKFSSKDKVGNRKGYHTLIIYDNMSNYKNRKISENIKLSFKSYLTLEENNNSDWSSKVNIQINDYTLPTIYKKLKKIKKWFTSKKNEDLFYLEDGKLMLNKEMATDKKFIKIINCGFNNVLKIIPAVISDKETRYEGILIFINTDEKYFEMTYTELKTLIYKLKKINLYEAGLAMLNYIGRPINEDEDKLFLSKDIEMRKIQQEYELKQNRLLNKSDNELKNSLGGFFK